MHRGLFIRDPVAVTVAGRRGIDRHRQDEAVAQTGAVSHRYGERIDTRAAGAEPERAARKDGAAQTDNRRYGVEWFFKNNNVQGDKTGIGLLDFGTPGIAPRVPGFSYSIVDTVGDVRAVLNLLAEESKLNVLSSPSLMVLDNRTAEIRVGNQVPVQTETAVTDGGVTVESIQFKDTGVLLSVTPGVNAGGLVTMDVSQEVTDVGPIDPATGQRTFLQRNIQSVVAVQSGETIVLGGLIISNESRGESGIPGLYKLPVLGKLFGQTEQTSDRTELLVLITPKVVGNQQDAKDITEEMRKRMRNIEQWPFDKPSDASDLDGETAAPLAPDTGHGTS